MKLKRICAFLIMVFYLSGCASDTFDTTMEGDRQVTNAQLSQLTSRDNRQLAYNMDGKMKTSLKQEVKQYAVSKTLTKKLVDQEPVQESLKNIMALSEAEQYKVEKPEPEPEVKVPDDSTQVAASDAFEVYTTLYGVDCYGCNVREDGSGNTAIGVQLNPNVGVMQSDGTWLSGLTYDGYYIIAMDPSIPFYSIVEISNHGLSGMGFSPDVPIKCMVLDRGGAIYDNHIDLYIGSEQDVNQIHYDGSQAVARILRYGS